RRHTRFSRDWSSDVCSSDLFVYSSFPSSRWKGRYSQNGRRESSPSWTGGAGGGGSKRASCPACSTPSPLRGTPPVQGVEPPEREIGRASCRASATAYPVAVV